MSGSTFAAAERLLVKYLQQLFPCEQTLVNVNKNLDIRYPDTNDYMEFDAWIPNHGLCFEFQDPHHYIPSFINQRAHANIRQKDNIKRTLALQHGLSLIDVPCWWDCSINSLIALILFHRPDVPILNCKAPPVSLNPPQGYFPAAEIPGVGEMTLVSFPNDRFYENFADNEWWMGEKYDGIRFCWNIVALYSRTGNVFSLHEKIVSELPSIFLDGEFWFGRGEFSFSSSLAGVSPNYWTRLRTVFFDVPCDGKRFEERYYALVCAAFTELPVFVVAPRINCKSKIHLEVSLSNILSDSGEGIILRKIGSFYEHGRARILLKIKGSQLDMEGVVINANSEGVVLKLPDGNHVTVSSSNLGIHDPQIGNIVTIAFANFARRGIPANPTVAKIRTDLTWDDVVSQYQIGVLEEEGMQAKNPNDSLPRAKWQDIENRRTFFENYARRCGFDPQNAENWYSQSLGKIMAQSGTRQIVVYHDNSIPKALCDLFPDVAFDVSKFSNTQFSNPKSRQRFFVSFARKNGFDPYNPEHWYKQSRLKILATQGTKGVLRHHNNSVVSALMDLFPNVDFDRTTLLNTLAFNSLKNPKISRKFIEKVAQQHGFDPLNPENWYTLGNKTLLISSIRSILNNYHSSLSKALNNLFPDIGLDGLRFERVKASVWSRKENRRRFFEQYAKQHDFEPLIPYNWYSRSYKTILSTRKARRIVKYHNDSVAKALVDLFPEVNWSDKILKLMEPKRHLKIAKLEML